MGPQKHQRAGDIRAVGIPKRDNFSVLNIREIRNKIRQLIRPQPKIILIKDPFGQAAEKTRHSVF